jgi:hypothetical protein
MHKCTQSGVYGATQAHVAVDDGPIFNAKNINEASFEAQLSFAKVLNKIESKQANVNIGKYTRPDHLKNILQNFRTPEALLPKQVYGKIDRKMTQWDAFSKRSFVPKLQRLEKKYEALANKLKDPDQLKALEVKKQREMDPIRKEAEKSYKDLLGAQFGQAREHLQDVFNAHGDNPKRLDAELKKMGMTRQDAYYANNYLHWLENGGPFFDFNPGSGNKAGGEAVQGITSNITGKKISFDPKQVLYNTSEFVQKAPAVAGFKNTLGGIIDAHTAANKAGLTIFDKLPELDRKGIYADDYTGLRPHGKYDTTARSQNMLDNLSYFTGKRMGNTQKAMAGIAYRPKPWNDTFGMQNPLFKGSFGFMSFQFRHMQQYGGWIKDAAIKRSPEAAKALAVYSVMTGVIFGDRAAVPAPLYEAIKIGYPDIDKDIKEFQGQLPVVGDILNTGVAGATGKALTGGALDVDMTKYARPFGGVAIGIGQDLVTGATDAATRTVPKTVSEVRKGDLVKAAAVAINGITQASQLHKNGANALIQKTVDGVTKAYLEDEFTPEGIGKYLGQKYLGKDAVSAAK